MQTWVVLLPEVILIAAALVALFAEFLGGDRVAAIVGTAAAVLSAALVWAIPAPATLFGGMLSFGTTAAIPTLRFSIASLTALLLLWVVARGWAGFRAREAVSLVLFATAGGMLLITANDLVVLFMALELATMPAYVLVGYSRNDRGGLEGALKYFLLSLLTSLLMAYGLSFVYGLSGTTAMTALPATAAAGGLALMAGLLVSVGFLAKITGVPFHFWSPDAYEGASATSVAFVSTIAKIGPVWAFVHVIAVMFPSASVLFGLLLGSSVLSMMLGNFVALMQTDVRRIIAYSGIANAGYLLLGVSAGTIAGFASAVYFIVVYSVGVLGMMLVIAQEGSTLSDVAGLVNRRPYAAWCSIAFLFSLIGFPPMVGFFGKLAVFSAAYYAGNVWAVIIAILMSVVSAGYAFAIIKAMFTPGEGAPQQAEQLMLEESTDYVQYPRLAASVILVLMALVMVLGLVVQPLVKLIGVELL